MRYLYFSVFAFVFCPSFFVTGQCKDILINLHYVLIIIQVTTKGAGLNPNAKVWQEIPASQNDNQEEPEGSPWLQTSPSSAEMSDGMGLVGSVCLRMLYIT